MWKGTPVIGGNVGGIRYQIEDGVNGFLVSSVEEAAERMVRLLKDEKLREEIGHKARETVREKFLLTRYVEQYLDLFGAFETNFHGPYSAKAATPDARALRFGLEISDDITALHVSSEENDNKSLREAWAEKVERPARAAKSVVPRLEIIHSPYRQIYEPILKFVRKREKENPDRLIAVVIPELVEPHWYEYLLHNIHGAGLRALLFLQGDRRTIVITTPWYLRET